MGSGSADFEEKLGNTTPEKEFFEAPTGGSGSSCKSCAHCPWMGLNSLTNLEVCVKTLANEINLDEELIQQAKIPLDKMISFNV